MKIAVIGGAGVRTVIFINGLLAYHGMDGETSERETPVKSI